MHRVYFCLKLLILVAASIVPAVAAAATKPNILFIAVDDLNGWGVTAMKGRAGVKTLNLDRLAGRAGCF